MKHQPSPHWDDPNPLLTKIRENGTRTERAIASGKIESVGEVIERFVEKHIESVANLPDGPVPKPEIPVELRLQELKRRFGIEATRQARSNGYSRYEYTDQIIKVLKPLFDYFIGIEGELNLNKGVLIIGPTGSGKTQIMKIFAAVLANGESNLGGFDYRENRMGFVFKSVSDLCSDLDDMTGDSGAVKRKEFFNDYGKRITSFKKGLKFNHICFDDLHKEEVERLYSYGKNPIKTIINARYDRINNGIITHATSNYELEEMKAAYGAAMVDRLRAMFNIIDLVQESFRS